MSTQVNIRLDDTMVESLDREAAERGVSRPEVVREVLNEWRRKKVSEAIAEAYRRAYTEHPETDEEMAWAEWSASEAIAAEPWDKWW
jgi:Arc/MetJ-type ribon-helix-helix transcriptional regulator